MYVNNWLKPGFEASYRFVRVSHKTGLAVGQVTGIMADTLSVSRDDDSATKESGRVDYVGSFDIGSDLLRVYLDAEFHDGSRESVPLGTFMCLSPSRKYDGQSSVGTVDLYGRLKAAAETHHERTVTVEAGSNAVDMAAQALRECGLDVVAEPSDYRLGSARTYSADSSTGSTKLDMANDLLGLAAYRGAWTDGNGTVRLTPLVDPNGAEPVWRFEEGQNARFLPDATDERDTSSVRNLVRVTFSKQDRSFVGTARDDSPDSEFSTVSLGRVISMVERLSDVPDDADDRQIQAMADERARALLAHSQSVKRSVRLTTAHCPVWYGDVVEADYWSAGISGRFTVASMSLSDHHGAMTEITLRRYER